MKKSVQPNLPGFPTLRAWVADWLDREFHGEQFPWDETRDKMRDDVPWRFIPDPTSMQRAWWAGAFQKTTKALGYRRFVTPAHEDAPVGTLDEQLSLDDLYSTLAGDLILARQDVDAVRRRLVAWNEAHPGEISDVDGLFGELLSTVGLAEAG